MAQRHTRSRKKPSGGRTRRLRKPKKYEQGGEFAATRIGDQVVERSDTEGGTSKTQVKQTTTVNLAVDGEVEPVKITDVRENPANQDYVRRGLLTKGTVVETERGPARVTSRPGQDGSVDAVLLNE